MNFYAHLAIASLYSEELGAAFGAMLPDFASLVGAKPPESSDPHICRGYELHVASDRVFHETDEFRRACARETGHLLAGGLERGAALGAAHVGVELLLDDALADDEPTYLLFRRTLTASKGALGRGICWASPDQASGFESLRQRLENMTCPIARLQPIQLSERICRTLARRPRLAVRATDRAALEAWAQELPLRCATIWPELVDGVVRGLAAADWHVHPGLERRLRFRRAWSGEV